MALSWYDIKTSVKKFPSINHEPLRDLALIGEKLSFPYLTKTLNMEIGRIIRVIEDEEGKR